MLGYQWHDVLNKIFQIPLIISNHLASGVAQVLDYKQQSSDLILSKKKTSITSSTGKKQTITE